MVCFTSFLLTPKQYCKWKSWDIIFVILTDGTASSLLKNKISSRSVEIASFFNSFIFTLVLFHSLHLSEKIYLFPRITTKIPRPYNWISAATESYPLTHVQSPVLSQSRSSLWMKCREKMQHEGAFHSRFFLMLIVMGFV